MSYVRKEVKVERSPVNTMAEEIMRRLSTATDMLTNKIFPLVKRPWEGFGNSLPGPDQCPAVLVAYALAPFQIESVQFFVTRRLPTISLFLILHDFATDHETEHGTMDLVEDLGRAMLKAIEYPESASPSQGMVPTAHWQFAANQIIVPRQVRSLEEYGDAQIASPYIAFRFDIKLTVKNHISS